MKKEFKLNISKYSNSYYYSTGRIFDEKDRVESTSIRQST